jgi:carboxymethylenebutenolidase
MCHGAPVQAFPKPIAPESITVGDVLAYRFQNEGGKAVALLPDIYGCNEFYRGLATWLYERGADVYLVDPFAGLGELPEVTREAAFARRGKVMDRQFLDAFETFAASTNIKAVIGFCLGGLYVFELARRGMKAELLGLYGFPQGLPNADALPVPFDYLQGVTQPFTMLMGSEDASVGPDHLVRLSEMVPVAPAMTLRMYPGVGHNFLPLLDSDDPEKRAIAEDALQIIGDTAL